ncbi:MAG: hypothetical protein LUQ62_00030 [Methanomicrobiales archaeon]|nr:hypothetical protein [Methanomicrobiales archaeon]
MNREPPEKPLIPPKYYPLLPVIVVLLVMAALFLGPILVPGGSGGSSQEPSPTLTLSGTTTPASSTTFPTQPTATNTQETPTATASPTYPGPPDFSLATSPTSVTAGRGETVTYTMVIEGMNGFSAPVTLELTASALFVTRTYDFGTYDPPFPRTIQYPFTVPDYLPPGVAVDGTLRATGGGLVRENRLTLLVG